MLELTGKYADYGKLEVLVDGDRVDESETGLLVEDSIAEPDVTEDEGLKALLEIMRKSQKKGDEEEVEPVEEPVNEAVVRRARRLKLKLVEMDRLIMRPIAGTIYLSSIERLEKSIRELGRLLYPVLVRQATDVEKRMFGRGNDQGECYFVIDGVRRIEALKRIKATYVPAIVIEVSDSIQEALSVVAANHVRGCNVLHVAGIVRRLKKQGYSFKEIRDALARAGCRYSVDTIRGFHALTELTWELREFFSQGYISVAHAMWLGRCDKDRQQRIANRLFEVYTELTGKDSVVPVTELERSTARRVKRQFVAVISNEIEKKARVKPVRLSGQKVKEIDGILKEVDSLLREAISKQDVQMMQYLAGRIERLKYLIFSGK